MVCPRLPRPTARAHVPHLKWIDIALKIAALAVGLVLLTALLVGAVAPRERTAPSLLRVANRKPMDTFARAPGESAGDSNSPARRREHRESISHRLLCRTCQAGRCRHAHPRAGLIRVVVVNYATPTVAPRWQGIAFDVRQARRAFGCVTLNLRAPGSSRCMICWAHPQAASRSLFRRHGTLSQG